MNERNSYKSQFFFISVHNIRIICMVYQLLNVQCSWWTTWTIAIAKKLLSQNKMEWWSRLHFLFMMSNCFNFILSTSAPFACEETELRNFHFKGYFNVTDNGWIFSDSSIHYEAKRTYCIKVQKLLLLSFRRIYSIIIIAANFYLRWSRVSTCT